MSVLKFKIIQGLFELFMHFNVHNLNLNYKYMLQFTKMARKIIHVSLGACLGPMQGMGMNYNLVVF